MAHPWYEILHDFAGPVATVIAAIAAYLVTKRLGFRQVEIARQQAATAQQQAAIASMRLQYDLFDRRFRIYNEAKILLVYFQRESSISDQVLDAYMSGTADSIFLLDQTVSLYLDELKDQAIRLRGIKQRLREPPPDEQTPSNKEIQLRNRGRDADAEAHLSTWFHEQFPILRDKFKSFLALQESPLRSPPPT